MTILPIRIFPDPILRKKARRVKKVDDNTRVLIRNMILTMQKARGVGLAAPQVGELKRIITIQVPEQEAFALVNPEVTKRTGAREVNEGCLSVPGFQGLITRSISIEARALDQSGSKLRLTAEELVSQAIEHEIDHLNGIMFLDHLIAHDKLSKTGATPSEPHWHDIGYTVYAHSLPPLGNDIGMVEVMYSLARLTNLNAESSLSESSYDLRSK